MKTIRSLVTLLFALSCSISVSFARDFELVDRAGASPVVLVDYEHDPVPAAVEMMADDIRAVADSMPEIVNGFPAVSKKRDAIIVGTVGVNPFFDRFLKKHHIETASLKNVWEAYRLQVIKIGRRTHLLVLGSDPLGTAYGVLEISRQIGVSPWVWWADSKPVHKDVIRFPSGFLKQDKPSVQYRGIFINDEDWGFMPWATRTLAPKSAKGAIGPEAYARICQLLLRLHANLLWPAMHECTVPFYKVAGNAAVARKYGIFIGTSHCEPLMRNNTGEWNKASMGDYDYSVNSDRVKAYWKTRVRETVGSHCLFTVGMRGIHDGKIQGAESLTDQKNLLEKVISDQRQLLSSELNLPLKDIPQFFMPYKEVLDVYNAGLTVPDDVTLVWCDDNYGYISRLSNAEEQKRSGGSGVYYHISYCGRPHDYLWLATTSPALVRFEMNRAWEQNAGKLWVLNVGDIKPGEYLTEYFLDLAWNAGKKNLADSVQADKHQPLYADHLRKFMAREFGPENAEALSQIMQTYYHLANLCKPEHMAWTRVEEDGFPGGVSPIKDTEFNRKEIEERLRTCAMLEKRVRSIEETLPGVSRPAFYQLVAYPVIGASLLNQKILYAQLARQAEEHHSSEAAGFAAASLYAYKKIQELTSWYNEKMSGGKWNRIMSCHPGNLYVFGEPLLPGKYKNITPKPLINTSVILRDAVVGKSAYDTPSGCPEEMDGQVSFNASAARPELRPSGLGHSLSAICLKKGESLRFDMKTFSEGAAELSIYTLPNYAVDGGNLRYEVRLNDSQPVQINTRTKGRSETWKRRVLRNQSVSRILYDSLKPGRQTLLVTALDDDVILDQVMLDFKTGRKSYLVPCTPAEANE